MPKTADHTISSRNVPFNVVGSHFYEPISLNVKFGFWNQKNWQSLKKEEFAKILKTASESIGLDWFSMIP